jgi:hypothetical protein
MKKNEFAGELFQSRGYLLINIDIMVTNTTTSILLWIIFMVILFWLMPDRKVKLIFGEIRKLFQILPMTKIAQAVISYFKNKK